MNMNLQESIRRVLREETRFSKMGEERYKSCSMSDITRMEIIDNFLKKVETNSKYNEEEPNYDMLLDDWDGYDDQVYIQNQLDKGKIIFYEGWVDSCWSAVYEKPQYKGMDEEEVIDNIITKRFPRIAEEFNMVIDDYGYFNNSDGYIMYIVFNMNLQESIRRILREETEYVKDVRVKISDILKTNRDGQSLDDAIVNVQDGLKSYSEGPPFLLKIGDKYEVLDGFHRIAQKILDGKKYIISDVMIKESNMNLQQTIRRILREESKGYDIVYRGQPYESESMSPRKSIWVTYDYDFAKEYGNVKKYKLPKDLNILDTDYYAEWESLIDEFDEGGEYDEYKYEPTDKFISFLKSKGYDGFINGDNILIFDKKKLFKK